MAEPGDYLDQLLDSALDDFQSLNLSSSTSQRSGPNGGGNKQENSNTSTEVQGLGMGLPDLKSKIKGKQKVSKESHTSETVDKLREQTRETIKSMGLMDTELGGENLENETVLNWVKQFEELADSKEMETIMETFMQQLLSKEVLEEPIKEICERYPKWLEENKSKISSEEHERFLTQYELMKELTKVFETESEHSNKIIDLMQKMQECGHPPDEIMLQLGGSDFSSLAQLSPENVEQCSIMSLDDSLSKKKEGEATQMQQDYTSPLIEGIEETGFGPWMLSKYHRKKPNKEDEAQQGKQVDQGFLQHNIRQPKGKEHDWEHYMTQSRFAVLEEAEGWERKIKALKEKIHSLSGSNTILKLGLAHGKGEVDSRAMKGEGLRVIKERVGLPKTGHASKGMGKKKFKRLPLEEALNWVKGSQHQLERGESSGRGTTDGPGSMTDQTWSNTLTKIVQGMTGTGINMDMLQSNDEMTMGQGLGSMEVEHLQSMGN